MHNEFSQEKFIVGAAINHFRKNFSIIALIARWKLSLDIGERNVTINAATLRRLSTLKLGPEAMSEVLAIIAEAEEANEHRLSKNVARQRRYRERHCNVTRDVTTPSPKEIPPTPPPEITPTPEKQKPLVFAKKTKTRTSIAEDARPSPEDQIFYMEHGSGQFDEDWAQFLDYHRSRGNLMLDWRAAWRTWVRNAAKFGGVSSNGHGRSNGTEGFVRSVLEDIENDKRRCEESNSKIVPMLQRNGERH
jgi:hypothetical protein